MGRGKIIFHGKDNLFLKSYFKTTSRFSESLTVVQQATGLNLRGTTLT